MEDIVIGGVRFPGLIWNASGPRCTTEEELCVIGKSAAAAVEIKSCTFELREGNPKPRYADLALGSINSMGLPNLGYKEYLRMAPSLKEYGKPLVASVSCLSLENNLKVLQAMNDSVFDLIELNLSCPNVIGKPQMGYDFEQTETVLREVFNIVKKPLGVKLPPYFDIAHFEHIASILRKFPLAFVVCINSVGNGLFIDVDKEQVVIKPKGGFGGIGGKYVKPTALANVRKFSQLLDVPVIGVGGISSGRDVFEYILAGATAVQVGTCFMKEGPGCFARIEAEFQELMQQKGYTSVDQFRGKLKVIE